jgi:chromosome partitioning protein
VIRGAPVHGAALDGAPLDVAPSELAMSTIERELASRKVGFESVLERALEPVKGSYDYVLIDCRPSTELLEVNAMRVANYLLIPILSELVSLYGTDQLIDLYAGVKEHYNPSLEILGVLLTKVDRRTKLAETVADQVRAYFGEKVFDTEIRVNVSLAEAPGAHASIFRYAPASRGAEDYRKLAEEVIARAE